MQKPCPADEHGDRDTATTAAATTTTTTTTTMVDIAVPPSQVWKALTTDDGLATWMGQGSTIEPRQGGAITTPDPAGGTHRHGRVAHIDKDRRIDFTWWPANAPTERTNVSIELNPTEAGTQVTVIEARPPLVPVARASWELRGASLSVSCTLRVRV